MSAGRSIAREMSSSYPFQQGCRQLGRTGIRHVGPAVLLVCRMCLSIEVYAFQVILNDRLLALATPCYASIRS